MSAVVLVLVTALAAVVGASTSASAAGTSLLTESFSGATVADPAFLALNSACLTRSTTTATGTALGKCATTNGPVPTSGDNGWLRLTDATTNVKGGVVYNRAIPAAAGLVVQFQQAQYGGSVYNPGSNPAPGDGIGFFLTDGAYSLTSAGSYGGALGYAQRNDGTDGVVGGYLGVGLDVYGNYANDEEGRGTGCSAASAGTRTPNAITLRGPGRQSGTAWSQGYCRVGTTTQLSSAYNVQPSFWNASTVKPTPATEATFVRDVRVTIQPQPASGTTGPDVTVELKFPGETSWGHAVTTTMPTRAPATYKLGWAASTGGASDIHLIRNVDVSTVDALKDLTIAKQVVAPKAKYAVGDTISYQFVVYNTGTQTLTNIAVSDPKVTNLVCPATTLVAGASTICTASHVVTSADQAAGSAYANTATATGKAPDGSSVTTDPSTATVNLNDVPSLSLVKSASVLAGLAVGNQVSYTFTVTNTGNVTLTGPKVVDGGTTYTCPATSLVAGASTTCTGPVRTVTQAQVDAGVVTNTATASATFGGSTYTATDSATSTTVAPAPAITMTKTASPTSGATLGTVVAYSLTAKNTGNVTLTGVTAIDDGTTYACTPSTLAPGASATCAVPSHAVTQAEVDAGSSVNTATATGTAPGSAGSVTSTPSTATTTSTRTAGIALVKTATKGGQPAAPVSPGDVLTYAFSVTNTGNVTLSAPVVTDAGTTYSSCTPSTLAPGASATCAGPTRTVTADDVDAGQVVNTATVTATPPAGVAAPTATATVTVTTVADAPSFSVTKTADATVVHVGDVIHYGFTVANDGNVPLRNPTVVDQGTTYVCAPTSLAVAQSATCPGPTHTVTQADVDAGKVDNVATGHANRTNGTPLAGVTASLSIPAIAATPSITLTKTASMTSGAKVGDVLTYSLTVKNTGNVTVTSPTVTDAGQTYACTPTSLAPQASATCAGPSHTVTQGDVDAGSYVNRATASAVPARGSGPVSSDEAVATTTTVAPDPALTLVKQATVGGAPAAGVHLGDTITYSFTVTNAGNVTVTAPTVADGVTTYSCPATTLAPGASTTCAGPQHVVTQGDLDAGSVVNVATASGTFGATPVTSPQAKVTTTTVAAAPALKLTKSASPASGATVGSLVTYSFVVENTGNVTLLAPTVRDGASSWTCPVTVLAPGDSVTCAGPVHTVTQAEYDAGRVVNTATADATYDGTTYRSPEATATTTTTAPAPGLVLTKHASPSSNLAVGQVVTYSFTLENTGDVTLHGLSVTDRGTTYTACDDATLAPGASTVCAGPTHTVTQADVDAGDVRNTASASATSPAGARIDSDDSTATATTVAAAPGLALVKHASPSAAVDVDDEIVYSFTLTNTGNVTLDHLAVHDGGTYDDCDDDSLAPGDSTDCRGPSHTVTQHDVDAGNVSNTASATATDPDGDDVDAGPTTVDVSTVQAAPALTLVKSAAPSAGVAVGDDVVYTFTLTNNGNVTLHDPSVLDHGTTYASCDDATLAPGDSTTCAGPTHRVTQADVDAGTVSNTAAAAALAPDGSTVDSPDATVDVLTVAAAPVLGLEKSVDPRSGAAVDDVLTYSFEITNLGNVTIHDPVALDAGTTYACPVTALAPGASTTCDGPTHVVTQADVDAGKVVNTATAQGTAPPAPGSSTPGATVTSPSSTATTTTDVRAGLALVKTAAPERDVALGDTVTYTFTVTNTGTVTVTDPVVSDAGTDYACAVTSIAPGRSTTCTGPSHVVTQADVDAGSFTNTAIASGTTPDASPVQSPSVSAVVTTQGASPALTLVKHVSASADLAVGDVLSYWFTVTNSGNVTIAVPTVEDGGTSYACADASLAPGATTTCAGPSRTVTQADVDAGTVTNTATASGNPPQGDPVQSSPSTVTSTTVPADASLSLVKKVSDTTGADVGDVLTYTFVVTNTGNVTISDPHVIDGATSYPCPVATLAPGESTTCDGPRHTVTQADVDAGSVHNTATAAGTDPHGTPVSSDPSTATSGTVDADPQLSLVKTVSATAGIKVGDVLVYTFSVTNTGNVTVENPVVRDRGKVYACPVDELAPGAQVTCAGPRYTVTQADALAGSVTNVATAAGTAGGEVVSSEQATASSTVGCAGCDPAPTDPADPSDPSTGPGGLATTGSDVQDVLAVALLAVLAGLALAAARRRARS
ncbi:hypothetical protein [Cellulomonas sp. HZM]|uniref:DUF7507 domain-containing protein n=1 Tax=Cellulomonas sp. HZM TaxID=1454010 RepID=UPI0018CC6AB9|nr:hypothetical protein [Cellulomonas sp. HZM]